MRKVLLSKYKYSYKDVFRWIGIIFMHFLGFYSFIMIMFAFHLLSGGPFIPAINNMNWGILYPMSIAPIVSGVLHIVYAERGYTNVKAVLWIHALVVAILVPVVLWAL